MSFVLSFSLSRSLIHNLEKKLRKRNDYHFIIRYSFVEGTRLMGVVRLDKNRDETVL